MNKPPDFLSAASRPERDVTRLRNELAKLRDLKAEKQSLEDRLAGINRDINTAEAKTLPDMMDEMGVNSVSLPATGSMPAVRAALTPYFAANIAAGWPEDRRQRAFAKLTVLGAEDLIKCELSALFGRGEKQLALLAADYTRRACGADPVVREAVHHQSLTAWLKEQADKGALPSTADLEAIGATVGRVVKLKEINE